MVPKQPSHIPCEPELPSPAEARDLEGVRAHIGKVIVRDAAPSKKTSETDSELLGGHRDRVPAARVSAHWDDGLVNRRVETRRLTRLHPRGAPVAGDAATRGHDRYLKGRWDLLNLENLIFQKQILY